MTDTVTIICPRCRATAGVQRHCQSPTCGWLFCPTCSGPGSSHPATIRRTDHHRAGDPVPSGRPPMRRL